MKHSQIITGDCLAVLATMPDKSVHCCVTSPPYYGLRDYGHNEQIGLEPTPDEYVAKLVAVFREVGRVLRDDGTLWLNLGDSYARKGSGIEAKTNTVNESQVRQKVSKGLKNKDLIGIPWRVAFALQADGWCLRQDIIWHKPNTMPESVTDRCTKAHEYIFLLSKSQNYYYDHKAIAEPAKYAGDNRGARTDARRGSRMNSMSGITGETRNRRSVWTVTTKPYVGAHFATFPKDLILPCILAGCPIDGIVLDPFSGAGTSGLVALSNGRKYLGIELNPEYVSLSITRMGVLSCFIEVTT